MHIRTLLLAAVLLLSVPAAADFETVVKAHEVRVSDIRLPGTATGTLSFKSCVECPYQTVRVTATTRYEANGRNYTLEQFRSELEANATPRSEWLTVMHHLESNTITAVQAIL